MATDNKLLGQFDLMGIASAPRGMPQIEVTFDIDANGIVQVSAKDKATNKEHQIRIQASGGLNEDEISQMVKDAESNAEADKKRREFVEAKNQAESMINATEKTLSEHGDKISQEDKAKIEVDLATLKEAITGEDADNIKEKTDALMQSSMKLGEALYKAQAEASEAGSDNLDADQPQEGTIVDAEFEDIKDDRASK
jgi:molecular chaperone DnaK